MANNTRIAELQKKFKGNEKAAPTPESQFGMLKKSKEEQAKAVRIAKARAARYNMTLRSLAIQTTQDVSKMQRADRDAKVETAKRAAKYNMTSRALPVAIVVSKKDQENLGKALADEVSPTVAKEVLTAVAKKTNDENLDATAKILTAPEGKKPVKQAKEAVKEEIKAEGTPKGTRATRAVSSDEGKEEKQGKKIVMEGLGEALSNGDEDAINRSILKSFLESSAPHLVGQLDNFMESYKSHMQDLFDKLIKSFPDAHDAEINGRNKADKEVAEAAENAASPKQSAKPVLEEKLPDKAPEAKKAPEKVPEVKKAPEKVLEVKKEAPPAEKEDDENSLGMYPEDMPDMSDELVDPAPVEKNQKKRVVFDEVDESDARQEDKNKGDDIADDDSLVVDQDTAFNSGYEDVIKKAEENPETQIKKSVTRRGSVQRIDEELTKELETTYKETAESKRKSVQSIVSVSSIAQIDEPSVLEGGYIIAAELKEDEKEDAPVSRWAVQLQGKNFALRQKLIKQGLSKQQVDDLVENLESNTSEML